MCFPQSLVLTYTIPNWMGASTFSGMSRKAPSSILRSKTPTSLMGATKAMCQAPLCFTEALVILGIQPGAMFCLVGCHIM